MTRRGVRSLRRATPVAVLLTSLALLAACTGGAPPPGPTATTTAVDPGPRPDDVVTTAVIPRS